MPLRIPAGADLGAALVLAQADRGDQILKRTRVGIGHMAADVRRVIGCIFLVGRFEQPRELLAFGRHLRVGLELDVHVGFGPLFPAHRAVLTRHAVIEQHHVVLNHAEPFRLVLRALQRLALLDVGTRAVRARLLVVPQDESNRPLRLHVGAREHARHFHDERRSRSVVVRRFAPPVAVHVAADDVHLVGVRRPDLGAEGFFARPVGRRLHVQRAKLFVGLLHRIGVDAGPRADAAQPATALRLVRASPRIAASAPIGRRRLVFVMNAVGRAAVALELRLDPVDCRAVAVGALTPVAELRESFDRRLVFLEVEPRHERGDRIVGLT